MSLDNFQMPPSLVAKLYKDSLVDLNADQSTSKSLKGTELTFLGNNKKNILVIVDEKNAAYLPDELLNFLIDILSACKLYLEDIALINIHRQPVVHYKELLEDVRPETIICFGVHLERLQFPLEFPEYQVQQYDNKLHLSAPSLQVLASDKKEKLQLWNCLKKIFAI